MVSLFTGRPVKKDRMTGEIYAERHVLPIATQENSGCTPAKIKSHHPSSKPQGLDEFQSVRASMEIIPVEEVRQVLDTRLTGSPLALLPKKTRPDAFRSSSEVRYPEIQRMAVRTINRRRCSYPSATMRLRSELPWRPHLVSRRLVEGIISISKILSAEDLLEALAVI